MRFTDTILIRNIEQYYYLKNLGVEKSYVFDYNVYTGNKIAKDYYQALGERTTAPLELNDKELFARGVTQEEFIVYGYMPAMISAGCGLKTCNLCDAKKKTYDIRDRKGNIFYTKCICEYCHNIMYNCRPLSLFKFADEIKKMNPKTLRLSFTVETSKEIDKILNRTREAFIRGNIVSEENTSTRGHFKRGVL